MKQVDITGLSPAETRVLTALKDNPTFTMKDLAVFCGLGTTRVGQITKKLKEIGKLERVGSRKDGYWKVI